MALFNHTIDDSDPVFKFYPYADGDFTGGWSPWFADSGGFRDVSVPGEDGVGQSMHYTAFGGASVFLEFHGSAIYVFGSANCSYDVTVDSTTVGSGLTSKTNLLFSTTGLSLGTHFLNLTAHASNQQQLALDSAVVSDALPNGVDSLVSVVYDNTNSTLQYSGDWEVDNDNQIPSKAAPKPYHQTSASMASASLNFTGSAIAINGALNWGHWTYNVTLDGVSRQYNASTFWLVGNAQLFYESGLDPTEPHQVTLINSAGAGMVMSLNDFTVYAPNVSSTSAISSSSSLTAGSSTQSISAAATSTAASSSSSKVDAGVIAGPVVGGVALIAIILATFFWLRRRRLGGPTQDPPAPYFEGYSSPNLNAVSEKVQTVLSPPSTVPYQSNRPSTDAPFNPYASQSAIAPTDSRTALSQAAQSSPQSAPGQAQPQQPVDVERIIELIAQRIDRPPPADHEIPPQYPH